MLIVFDFDKTLTKTDTIFGFYKEVDEDNFLFPFKKIILLFAAILMKLNIISNTTLKKVGVGLFLKNKTKIHVEKAGAHYAKKIELNNVYDTIFLKYQKEERMIISASFDIYLEKLLPGENIVASTLQYENGNVSSVGVNMYSTIKRDYLMAHLIEKIDIFYTDSFSDRALMDISDVVYFVKKDTVKCIKKVT